MFGDWRRRWTLVYVNPITDHAAQYRFQDPDGYPVDFIADHRRLTVDEVVSHLERLRSQGAMVAKHTRVGIDRSEATDQ